MKMCNYFQVYLRNKLAYNSIVPRDGNKRLSTVIEVLLVFFYFWRIYLYLGEHAETVLILFCSMMIL